MTGVDTPVSSSITAATTGIVVASTQAQKFKVGVCVSDLASCSKMAGEDIQGSTNAEVVSALSTITASGNVVSASLNLLQAFNPVSALS